LEEKSFNSARVTINKVLRFFNVRINDEEDVSVEEIDIRSRNVSLEPNIIRGFMIYARNPTILYRIENRGTKTLVIY